MRMCIHICSPSPWGGLAVVYKYKCKVNKKLKFTKQFALRTSVVIS